MSSIVIKGNTSGQVEIAAPDVAGSTTLTLPTGTGTVITTNNIDSNPPASLSTASGSAPSYSARAWVNFNGTGTVAIRDSGNVSSITDNGNGDYDINLTTAMPDTNGSIGACAAETVGSNTGGMRVVSASFSSTTVIKVSTLYQNGQVANPAFVGVQVFR
jgi:hypothetical protein